MRGSTHYDVVELNELNGSNESTVTTVLRAMFPVGVDYSLNWLFLTTGGVHALQSNTLDDIELPSDVTVLVVRPRMCTLLYGNVLVETPDDVEWLRTVVARSLEGAITSQVHNLPPVVGAAKALEALDKVRAVSARLKAHRAEYGLDSRELTYDTNVWVARVLGWRWVETLPGACWTLTPPNEVAKYLPGFVHTDPPSDPKIRVTRPAIPDWVNDATACFRDLVPWAKGRGCLVIAEGDGDWSARWEDDGGEAFGVMHADTASAAICGAFLAAFEATG